MNVSVQLICYEKGVLISHGQFSYDKEKEYLIIIYLLGEGMGISHNHLYVQQNTNVTNA